MRHALQDFRLLYRYSTSQRTREKCQSETKDVSAHYPDSLWLLGMKVTAPNSKWGDGNLSDTLNNLLMQKLKVLSVSLGGGEESRVAYNEADTQKTGICPSAGGHQTTVV